MPSFKWQKHTSGSSDEPAGKNDQITGNGKIDEGTAGTGGASSERHRASSHGSARMRSLFRLNRRRGSQKQAKKDEDGEWAFNPEAQSIDSDDSEGSQVDPLEPSGHHNMIHKHHMYKVRSRGKNKEKNESDQHQHHHNRHHHHNHSNSRDNHNSTDGGSVSNSGTPTISIPQGTSAKPIPFPRSSSSSSRLPIFRNFQSASQRRPSSLMTQTPHLLSEDYTSPVLDSTVELITNQNFNDVDVVQLSHSHTGASILRNAKSRSNSTASSDSDATESAPLADTSAYPPSSTGSSLSPSSPVFKMGSGDSRGESFTHMIDAGRKSISFYTYSDLVNFERSSKLSRDLVMSPATTAAESATTDSAPGSPQLDSKHQPDLRGRASPPSAEDNCDLFSIGTHQDDNVNSMSSTGNGDDGGSIHAWPQSRANNKVGDYGAPLEACFSRGAALETGGLDSILCDDNFVDRDVDTTVDSMNICTAKDLLQSKSRQLCNCREGCKDCECDKKQD